MVTKQLGPGMFQQFQTQECEQCSNVKYARESETLQVTVEPGMQDKEVSHCSLFGVLLAHAFVLQPLINTWCLMPKCCIFMHRILMVFGHVYIFLSLVPLVFCKAL